MSFFCSTRRSHWAAITCCAWKIFWVKIMIAQVTALLKGKQLQRYGKRPSAILLIVWSLSAPMWLQFALSTCAVTNCVAVGGSAGVFGDVHHCWRVCPHWSFRHARRSAKSLQFIRQARGASPSPFFLRGGTAHISDYGRYAAELHNIHISMQHRSYDGARS